jgi:5'-3' exoribonuclease 1
MGIVRYWSYFKNQFGEDIKNMPYKQTFAEIGVEVDNLMIDMNGILHNSAQRIYEYGNYKPNPRLLRGGKPRYKPQGLKAQLKLFEHICKTVNDLLRVAKPRKRLLLCVDGVAPCSKISQQRKRRFRSAMETSDDCVFNSASITPGTKFMDYLMKYIDWYIRKKISEDSEWQKVEVTFSPQSVCSEGEHKIVQYIRSHGDPDDVFCMFGLDADLIMLTLATHMPKFYILREDMYTTNNAFFCINIGAIREKLAAHMRWEKSSKQKFNEIIAINDFIFMCFMVGNDFLPHIPSIEIIERGIELLLEVYKEVGTSYGHLTRIVDGKVYFRLKPMAVFLGTIGQHEKSNFENKLSKKESFFPDPIVDGCSVQDVEGNWDVDIEKYKKDYLVECFPEGTDEQKLCHEYLEGMQWILSYYTTCVPSWKWCFPYHYAPPASVIAKHTETFRFVRYKPTEPNTPFQQLLCVLPPKSADLLPKPLCNLLTDEKSPLKPYCPDEFEIDLSGKRKEWEGITLLPQIDFELVRKCYQHYISKVDQKELKRNISGHTLQYEYTPNAEYVFHSYYGDIERCRAKTHVFDL